ncbi:hypothetical protein [Actinosynnema sp. NPDC020468]|uniref:hypothetical protein n=1 Tax=Actinosynnema sp. NPDC020468 TaxID=3154488 RepID=UPI003407713B
MRADVVLARCGRDSALYGLRVEQRPDAWYVTWAFALDEKRASGEKYGAADISGLLLTADDFPGCPRCKVDSFVKCGLCGRFTCWRAGERRWRCRWAPCRSHGAPSGSISSFSTRGDR